MYTEYFGFREKPFNVTPDPRFYYTNPSYEEAYASLLYGIRERKGFVVLTGALQFSVNLKTSVYFILGKPCAKPGK